MMVKYSKKMIAVLLGHPLFPIILKWHALLEMVSFDPSLNNELMLSISNIPSTDAGAF
jgi:hypothetical protein